jgi:hypothetical protein
VRHWRGESQFGNIIAQTSRRTDQQVTRCHI